MTRPGRLETSLCERQAEVRPAVREGHRHLDVPVLGQAGAGPEGPPEGGPARGGRGGAGAAALPEAGGGDEGDRVRRIAARRRRGRDRPPCVRDGDGRRDNHLTNKHRRAWSSHSCQRLQSWSRS